MLETKSNHKQLAAFLCVITCLLLPAVSFAAPPSETRKLIVTGSGGIRKNDTAKAREAAIKTSLMAAVDMVVAEQLPIGVMVQNFASLSPFTFRNTDTLVLGYRVLSETSHHKQYRVLVEAVVDVNRVKKDLAQQGFAAGRQRLPAILMLIAWQQESEGERCYWWGNRCKTPGTTDALLAARLRKKGFPVVTPGPIPETLAVAVANTPEPGIPEAAALAEHYSASIVIVGQASHIRNADAVDGPARSVFAARAVDAKTGAVIATTRQTETGPANDSGEMSEALMAAVGKAGEDLAKKIVAGLNEGKKTTAIHLDVSGDSLLLNLIKFRKVLAAQPGVDRIRTQKMGAGRSSLLINYQKDSQDLVNTIMQQSFESFTVDIVEVTEGGIKLKLTTRKSDTAVPRATDSPG